MNKQALYERIRTMLLHIESKIVVNSSTVSDLLYRIAEYKTGNQCPKMICTPKVRHFWGVYFNGVPQQGMDFNHTSVVLPDVPELDVHIYAYTGTVGGTDALGLHPQAEKGRRASYTVC